MPKVQITLTYEEAQILTDAAKKCGYSLHRIVQIAVMKEVEKSHKQMIKNFQKAHGDLWE